MKTRFCCLGFAMFIVAGLTGCGQSQDSHSHQKFIAWQVDSVQASGIADARADVYRICLNGQINPADEQRVRDWTVRAALTWLRPLKKIDAEVTDQLMLTCDRPHMTIRLRPGSGTSFASPSIMTIYLSRPFGTWSHEFGHAFTGLADTYQSGAGKCFSNQPQSLMCWGAYGPRKDFKIWSTLWPDDIDGLYSNYEKIIGETDAPSFAGQINSEKSFSLEKPWPGFELVDTDSQLSTSEDIESVEIDYSYKPYIDL